MARQDPLHAVSDNDGLHRRTLHGAGATAVAQVLKFALQFSTQLVLARLLDPAQFGLVAMVMPVLGLVLALNDFGLGQAIVQHTDITHRQVSALFWLNLGIGAGFTVAAMLLAPLIAALYGEPRTLWVTIACASLILLTSLSVVPLGLLNRQMRFGALAVVEVLAMSTGLVSGIVAALHGAGYWSLVIMQAVNSTASMLLAWAACGWRPGPPRREPGVSALMRFGVNLMGSNLASYLSMSADNVIVGVVSGKVQLGLYDRSYNLVVKPLWQLMAPTSRVAIPLLSRLQAVPDQYGRAYITMLQLTNLLCAPGLIATMVVAGPLIALALGPKWIAMVPVFTWICFGGLAASLSSSSYWLFTTQNRTHEQVRVGTVTALISVASFALGAAWGAVGVAKVSALSFMFLQTPFAIWAATRRGPVARAMVGGAMAPLLVAAPLCALAAFGVARVWIAPGLGMIVADFTTSYAVFLLVFALQPAGRQLLAGSLGMLRARQPMPVSSAPVVSTHSTPWPNP